MSVIPPLRAIAPDWRHGWPATGARLHLLALRVLTGRPPS